MVYRLTRVLSIVIFLVTSGSLLTFAQGISRNALGAMGFDPVSEQKAPDFNLTDLQGKYLGTANLKGKLILLNFWATWCAPCREEMQSLERLYQTFADRKDFQIIAVDVQEGPGTITAFLRNSGYHFPVALDRAG
jgi:thiol-disulfide isomerase/thioredoxin